MPKVIREREMAVPLKALRQVVVDVESYPKFLPEVVSAQVEKGATARRMRVNFELEVVKRFQYSLDFDISDDVVAWKLVKSNFFKVNEGRWVLKSVDSDHTFATYELDVDFGFLVPQWISRKLTEISLPKMLENFETRTKQVNSL